MLRQNRLAGGRKCGQCDAHAACPTPALGVLSGSWLLFPSSRGSSPSVKIAGVLLPMESCAGKYSLISKSTGPGYWCGPPPGMHDGTRWWTSRSHVDLPP